MRVAIFVVNFHADDHVRRLIDSIASASTAEPSTNAVVHVLDNSSKSDTELAYFRSVLRSADLDVQVMSTGANSGYFGPLPLAQSLAKGADVVIYCNPDIVLAPDFFTVLCHLQSPAGVLAPSIITAGAGFDQNPMYVKRLTAAKLRRLQIVYSSKAAFALYAGARYVREAVWRARGHDSGVNAMNALIYAPHGSLFLFVDVPFFLGLPAYPCFLFGEELFVAEEARLRGVAIAYEPRLRVDDVRHASISKLPSESVRTYLHESVTFILSHYYGMGENS